MKLTTKLFLGTEVALIFAGCSSRNTDNLQADMQSMNESYKKPQAAPTSLTISYSSNPSMVDEEVMVIADLGNAEVNCGKLTLQTYMLAGSIVTYDTPGADWAPVNPSGDVPVGGIYEFSFTPTVIGEYRFRGQYNSNGSGCDFESAGWTEGDPLIIENSCETEFTGVAISCSESRDATYTFTSADALEHLKIQGGLTNFTGGDAVVTVSGGDLAISQWTSGHSTNRVISVTGSVDACETITIHITWNSTNAGGVITGEWSAKNNGVEVAPEIPGLTCE